MRKVRSYGFNLFARLCLTFLFLANDELKNHSDRISILEKQGKMAKLMTSGGEGGPDPSIILNALAEMENDIKAECERRYAPLSLLGEF